MIHQSVQVMEECCAWCTVEGRGKPLNERSTFQLVSGFIIAPIILGGATLTFTAINAAANAHGFGFWEWFCQVAVVGFIGLTAMTLLPTIGWQELRHRWRIRKRNQAIALEKLRSARTSDSSGP